MCIVGYKNSVYTYHSNAEYEISRYVVVKLKNKQLRGLVVNEVSKPSFQTQEIMELEDLYLPKASLELARFISSYYCCSLGETLKNFIPFRIMDKSSFDFHPTNTIILSDEQENALQKIVAFSKPLLFGVTGSGKTEVFMKFFESYLLQNKRILFLMPEISLTSQMKQRLQDVFGDCVAIWHSKLTKKQKNETLNKIYDGSAKVIAGARSALFLPIKDLGCIVVDEEHDDAYKSFSNPKINAKDVAQYYAKLLDIKVLLASATPTLASYLSKDVVRLHSSYFQTDKRYIIDESPLGLSNVILGQIEKALLQKQQVIVFVPTRANFKYLVCKSCGVSVQCPYCSVGMSLHLGHNLLRCHYCHYATKIPDSCLECGGELESQRLGTQEVVDTLNKVFPLASVEKFDKDTMTTAAKLQKTLQRLSDKKIDILVGTQMLSKGHNYHGVQLAVILGLDHLLGLGDFRAQERAVSLMHQVSGRAGRKGEGIVVIQTQNRAFLEKYIDDYENFLKDEKEQRLQMYPPFVRFMRFLFSHKKSDVAKQSMQECINIVQKLEDIEIVGAGKAPIELIASKYRYVILLRSQKATNLIRAYHHCSHIGFDVDMDPLNFS